MSEALGYDSTWQRDIGYGVPSYCDHPDCGAEINRGLSYVCGNMPYGGDSGCGLYFCPNHLNRNHCERCLAVLYAKDDGEDDAEPISFTAKPDHPSWVHWKLTNARWQIWRNENPDEVERMKGTLRPASMEGK